MSYPFNHNFDQSDLFDVPLEALPFDDFQSYFEARLSQPSQTAGPSSPKRPQQFLSIPSTSHPNSWHSDASSSSNLPPVSGSSLFPSSAWTPDASSSNFYSVSGSSQNALPPPPFASLTDNDYAFLVNIDPSFLAADLANVVANHSISTVSEPFGHGSPSRKRPRPNEEFEGSNNAFPDNKRRKLSTGGHPSLRSVLPPTNTYKNNKKNIIPNNDFYLPAPSASTSHSNAILSAQAYYPNPQIFDKPGSFINVPPAPSVTTSFLFIFVAATTQTSPGTPGWNIDPNADVYAPFMNVLPSVSSAIPPVHVSGTLTQLVPYNAGPVDGNVNADLHAAAATSDALAWDSLSYFTSNLNDMTRGPIDWTTGLPTPDDFYNTMPFPSVALESSIVVPPFLGQQTLTNETVYRSTESMNHTNTVANTATHSNVVDFRQHSSSTNQISTTGHVANAIMPNAKVPSTSVAQSVDPFAITYECLEPTPPSPSPSPTFSPKRKGPQKREPKPFPDEKLWYHNGKKYVCRYKGPDRPEGCTQESGSRRNLVRHIRAHAKRELGMHDLAADERVAFNGLPEGLLRVEARCKLAHAELHKCAFYREHGRRWVVLTMERPDNLERMHNAANHDR